MNEKNNLPMRKEYVFNDVTLSCPIAEGHRMIPVKTVCTVIDVDYSTQNNWLKKHPYFSQLYSLYPTTGADGKLYEMSCLSIFDINTWLGSIEPKQRRDGSLEKQYAFMAFIREKMIEEYKSIQIFQKENEYELELVELKEQKETELLETKNKVKELQGEVKQIDQTIEDIRVNRFTGQTALDFPA